ncbi:hypothetical protein [Streptomyces sp. NPDC090798]|uniref:hypothetical protein n=1 Tax=Streptomyces sp. NPDC090798 TaxID=3365968 RepID=UPI00380E2A7A
MARLSLTPGRTIFFRVMEWYSKRTYGKVLKALAETAVSTSVGCAWRMDFGYRISRESGMAREKPPAAERPHIPDPDHRRLRGAEPRSPNP